MDTVTEEPREPVRTLTAAQRRVLGALLEKAFTTPDAYPLTTKALSTACSQKSNRDPVIPYSEDDVEEPLEELQGLGLVAELHTDGGRAVRYRHLVRKRYTFTEPQLAILTELWLRGRQQMGELRTRASRMVSIASQDDLRNELQPLIEEGYVQAGGPLERRGVEVDHAFYPESETRAAFAPITADAAGSSGGTASRPASANAVKQTELEETCRELQSRIAKLEDRVARLEQLYG